MVPSPHCIKSAGSPSLNKSISSINTSGETKSTNVRVMVRIRPLKHKETCTKLIVNGSIQLKEQSTESSATPRRWHSRIPLKSGLKSPPSSRQHNLLLRNDNLGKRSAIVVPTQLILSNRTFDFDAVFPSDTTQSQLYQVALGDAIENNIFRGYNMTVLAYGQSGSGKTNTMYHETSGSLQPNDGIVRRAISDLFRYQQSYQSDFKVTIAMNCLELMNGEFCDLLSDSPNDSLKRRDYGSDHGVTMKGLQNIHVHSYEHANELAHLAASRRAKGSTHMNAQSSRSHVIYTFIVTMEPRKANQKIVCAKLTMVDLAGSDQIKQSGVVGSQENESVSIKNDLFVLGKVMSLLADKASTESNSIHIPYHDSKLTEYLQDSLGGNCLTLLIACVSPADIHADESMNTLRYAERSRSEENHVNRNSLHAINTSASESALQLENNRLKAELDEIRKRGARNENKENSGPTSILHIEEKIRRAKEEAKSTRESCLNVANQVSRWRDRRLAFSKEPPKLPRTDIDILDTVEIQKRSLNGTTEEVNSHHRQRDELTRELMALSNKIDQKRSDLEALETASSSKLESLRKMIQLEEAKRDELVKEVSAMKQRIHLMATDLRDDKAFPQIFRSRSEDNDIHGDVEMKTIKTTTWKDQRITEMEKELQRVNEENKILRAEQQNLIVQKNEMSLHIDDIVKQYDNIQEMNKLVMKENELLKQQLKELEEQRYAEETLLRDENEALKSRLANMEKENDTHEDLPVGKDGDGFTANQEKPVCPAENGGTKKSEEYNQKKDTLIRLMEKAVQNNIECLDSVTGSYSSTSELQGDESKREVYIDNMNEMNAEDPPCNCGVSSVFAKKEYVMFYLPKVGVTCSCGKRREDQLPPDADPSALSSILREWQVDFLKSCGISDCIDFLNAVKQRKLQLAREMRVWRKQKGFPSMKTQSCSIALYIWSRTCRVVVRNVAEQKAKGIMKPSRPDFLDVSLFSDGASMSTLGLRSAGGRRDFV